MSQVFPTSLNNYTGAETDLAAEHAQEHNALEAKVGANSSAVVTSLDYLVKSTSSSDPGHKHTSASITGITFPSGAIVGTTDTQTLTNKTFTAPVLASFYQDAGKTKLMTTPNTVSDTLTANAATQTLTNKRITKRVTLVTTSTTPSPDVSTTDEYCLTALGSAAAFGIPTGTPTDGQTILIRIKDDATPRALTYNAIYRAIGIILPTTTVASKTTYIGAVYNITDTKWDCIATATEA